MGFGTPRSESDAQRAVPNRYCFFPAEPSKLGADPEIIWPELPCELEHFLSPPTVLMSHFKNLGQESQALDRLSCQCLLIRGEAAHRVVCALSSPSIEPRMALRRGSGSAARAAAVRRRHVPLSLSLRSGSIIDLRVELWPSHRHRKPAPAAWTVATTARPASAGSSLSRSMPNSRKAAA